MPSTPPVPYKDLLRLGELVFPGLSWYWPQRPRTVGGVVGSAGMPGDTMSISASLEHSPSRVSFTVRLNIKGADILLSGRAAQVDGGDPLGEVESMLRASLEDIRPVDQLLTLTVSRRSRLAALA